MRASEAGFFLHASIFFPRCQLILMVQSSKQSFIGGLCSERNTFSRAALRACEAGFFFMDQIFLPRRFQRGIARPWEGLRSVFCSGQTQTGTEKLQNTNRYIDTYQNQRIACSDPYEEVFPSLESASNYVP